MSETTEELIEVRCPFERPSSKDGRIYPCNRLCVEVYPGSRGKTFCKHCHKHFEFEVASQDKHMAI